MKILPLLVFLLSIATTAHAGVTGFFSAKEREWSFVEKTGGIRIGTPIPVDDHLVLPVEYDVSGATAVTCNPVMMNSGLVVRVIKVRVFRESIVLSVVTQLQEKGRTAGPNHVVRLPDLSRGYYSVYYQSPGDPERKIGQIEIK